MSKKCARCEKAVYPLEELKCLDKIWHKGCFKCQECAMTLSMKTYKGYNKLPYCEAHIPKAKATAVAETPEMRRLAENTKIQSNVQYHADFEKNKAKFTQVADDPETQRLKKNTQIISNVIYHGELAKKTEMERKRTEPNDDDDDEDRSSWLDTFGGDIATATASVHQTIASHLQSNDSNTYDYSNEVPAPPHSRQPRDYSPHPRSHVPTNPYHQQQSSTPHQSGKQSRSNNNPTDHVYNENPNLAHGYIPPSISQSPNANTQYPPEYDDGYYPYPYSVGGQNASDNHYSGKPTNGSSGSYPSTNRHGASHANSPTNNHYAMQQQPNRRVGSIADYDPVNEQYGSISQGNANPAGGGFRQETTYQVQRTNLYGDQQPPPVQMNSNPSVHHKVNAPPTQLGVARC